MTKQELVEFIANKANLTKADALRALDAMTDGIVEGLKKEGKVALVGFGTFEARKRNARTGKNPQSGEAIEIPAATVPAFKAGKAFKDMVNAK